MENNTTWRVRLDREYGSFKFCEQVSQIGFGRLSAFIERELTAARAEARAEAFRDVGDIIDDVFSLSLLSLTDRHAEIINRLTALTQEKP